MSVVLLLKMVFNVAYFKKMDWVMIGSAVLLVCFGLAGIWSYSVARQDYANFYKQIIFFAAGLLLMIAVSFFDYRILRNNSYLILILYFLCFLFLIGTLFFGPVIGGARRWYRLGPVSVDPLEPAKIILIILLAKYFSMRHVEMYKLRHILISGFYVFLMAFPVFLRPNLGGAVVLTLVWLGILIVSGIKLKHFFILVLCFLIVAASGWQFILKDYQKARFVSFIFPQDVLGGAWSQIQAKISVGAGGVFGEGLGEGSQVQYGFLPEPHTDFIFSAIAQEWGVVGVLVFFILYLTLIWRILKTAVRSDANFPRLFATGFAVMLMVHFAINVGMNISILPVVGIYLPFVSYGGSGLVANFVSLGILQSIKIK